VYQHEVVDKDIFDILFPQVHKLPRHNAVDLSELVSDLFDSTIQCIVKHGCLLIIKNDTRLLVVHDEAQVLGDEFNGCFQSTTLVKSPRPPLHYLSRVSRPWPASSYVDYLRHWLGISTPFWIQSTASGLKDSSTDFEVSSSTWLIRLALAPPH